MKRIPLTFEFNKNRTSWIRVAKTSWWNVASLRNMWMWLLISSHSSELALLCSPTIASLRLLSGLPHGSISVVVLEVAAGVITYIISISMGLLKLDCWQNGRTLVAKSRNLDYRLSNLYLQLPHWTPAFQASDHDLIPSILCSKQQELWQNNHGSTSYGVDR